MFSRFGSAKVAGGPPGLQIRCEGLKLSQVGSIPMHFRHFLLILLGIFFGFGAYGVPTQSDDVGDDFSFCLYLHLGV